MFLVLNNDSWNEKQLIKPKKEMDNIFFTFLIIFRKYVYLLLLKIKIHSLTVVPLAHSVLRSEMVQQAYRNRNLWFVWWIHRGTKRQPG